MIRRPRVWLALAVVFTLANLGGAAFAARVGDTDHAVTHMVLLIPGMYLVRRLARRDERRGGSAEIPAGSPALGDRLSRLEQAIESVAIEVGRMSDGQRLITRAFTENREVGSEADQRTHG